MADELKAIQAALAALWPLDEEARQRAVAGIAGALGVGQSATSPGAVPTFGAGAGPDANGGGNLGDPKTFLATKAPESDIERVTVLAYYLTHGKGMRTFSTKDITEANVAAAGHRISNTSYAVSNATKKSGYLTSAAGGKKQITARGEALVEAMPDRGKVASAIAAMPVRSRRSGTRKKKAGDK